MKKVASYLYDKPALLILVFTLIAFLPVLLPFFYIKNDLVTQILPTRYIISESIHSGFAPWWNPYINYGIPQYSDMAAGFWNPFLWLVASLFRFNIWTITMEEVFYIFLSGWGMYLVLKELSIGKPIAIVAAFCFLSSGYTIGHLQHFCWITAGAFFPFVFLYFIRINRNPSLLNFLKGGLSGFLFLSSVHPGLIIGAIYFFVFAFVAILFFRKSFPLLRLHPALARNNILFLAVTVLLSMGILMSYAEAIPLLTRGDKLPGAETISNATTLQSYLSLLFPLAVHKSAIFNTDISMRNMYAGLLIIPGLFFFSRGLNKKLVYYTAAVLAFYILLSAGGMFKTVANSLVPLASYVRSSGEFSLFTIFLMILAAAAGLQASSQAEWFSPAAYRRIRTALGMMAVVFVVAFIPLLVTRHSLAFAGGGRNPSSLKEVIKTSLEHSSFWDLLIIQCLVNLVSVYLLMTAIKTKKPFRIAMTVSLNLVVICWLVLPFTGVGASSKKEVNALLTAGGPGIPLQSLTPATDFAIADTGYIAFTGMPYTYLKKMGTPAWDPYPIHLKNNANYFQDKPLTNFINARPYLFLGSDTTMLAMTSSDSGIITPLISGPGLVKAHIQNRQSHFITLLQNDYPHWEVLIDNKAVTHFTGYKSFITVAVPKGDFIIEYRFVPRNIELFAWVTGILLAVVLLLILFLSLRTNSDADKIP